jgi:hypothetical protein
MVMLAVDLAEKRPIRCKGFESIAVHPSVHLRVSAWKSAGKTRRFPQHGRGCF